MQDERSSEEKYWFTHWGMLHPIRVTIMSALFMGAWTSIIVGDRRAVAGVVTFMIVFIGFLLRPGGIVRRLGSQVFDDLGEK